VPRLLVILLLAAGLAGCTKTQAKTPEPPAALTTPEPPDRVIVPASIPEAIEPPPAPAPPPAVPARPRETPPARTDRPAPPAATPAAPVVEPPPSPPPILQTTSNPGEVGERAQALIGTAKRDLDRINPAQLTSNARAQYDSAKGFIRQAEDALKVKNVVLARELADKAAALASQLRR
jgi:hypothetical protein